MNRTLGFFLGSAVVFVMLVLILGQPVSLAPPSDRDQYSESMTATVPVRIPQPAIQRETPSLPQQSALPPEESPTESVAVQLPALPQVAEAAPAKPAQTGLTTVSEPVTAPVVIEHYDENKLVESWLASTPTQLVDDVNDGELASAVDAAMLAGSADAVAAVKTPEPEWFPLWDPFHSELSANAFARRLERVTGLDYRVIKTAPAQYRVTVGYTSEEQRIANLSLIEEATGLSVTGGRL